MNIQRPEPPYYDPEGRLVVNSIFKSIQGEGPYVGMPAVFIRLCGCTLACEWCDTDYSTGQVMGWPEIVKQVKELAGEVISLVVLTGGEPLRQNVVPLITQLVEMEDYRVQIETNGTVVPPDIEELSCCGQELVFVVSPKTSTLPDEIGYWTNYWKYVVREGQVSEKDGLPIDVCRPFGGTECCARSVVFVQPMDEKDEDLNKINLQLAVDICMKFGYRLSLQLHKIIGVP